MKKLLYAAIAIAAVCSCHNGDNNTKEQKNNQDIVIDDSTYYGDYYGNPYSKDDTFKITQASDTTHPLSVYIPNPLKDTLTESSDIVFGNIVPGSKFAVIGIKDELGEYDLVAKKVINLTTLMGKWIDKDTGDTLTLDDENSWIKNGQIIATGEPMDITYLNIDTLELESKDYIRSYRRLK